MRTLLVKVVRRIFAYAGVTVIGRATLGEVVARLWQGPARPALTGPEWSQLLQLRGQLGQALSAPVVDAAPQPVVVPAFPAQDPATASLLQLPAVDLPKRLDALSGRLLARSADAPESADRLRALAQFYAASATLVSRYPSPLHDALPPDDNGTAEDAIRAGVWIPGNEVEVTGEQVVAPWRLLFDDPETGVFLVMGQSNAANHGDRRHTANDRVFSFDFFRVQATVASDPLPGASGSGGSVWTRLGDRLINEGVFKRVLFIPIAFGGTYVADWAPNGSMNRRTAFALGRLRRALGTRIINVSAVLWQQGEAEANHTTMSAEQYQHAFQEVVADLRARGVFAPVMAACSTLCEAGERTHDNADEIRKALRGLDDPASGLLRGPDTDVIGHEDRYDRCHLADSGLSRCADLWFAAIRRDRPLLEKL
ncbi:MAG TPA: sialate O-acetylesterase [Alphaproteobacteria bacterium]|nr:sialate O-acetylesterase [Alphaproteobacteria bacterium]